MVEIGPNLKEVLIKYIESNIKKGWSPGYLLKESFGAFIEKAVGRDLLGCAQTINNCIQKMPDHYTACDNLTKRTYPTKSGYYWFYDSFCKQKRVVYFEHKLNKVYYHGSYYPRYIYTLNEEGSEFKGYFIQPMRRLTI